MQFGINKYEYIFQRQQQNGRVQFAVFIQKLLLVNNVHEKNITESQNRRNFESVHALLVICTRVKIFVLVLHENALFSANQKRAIFRVHCYVSNGRGSLRS